MNKFQIPALTYLGHCISSFYLCCTQQIKKKKKHQDGNLDHVRNQAHTTQLKDKLVQTFTDLHFKVKVHENLTSENMLEELKKLAKWDHSQFCAFFCCILSHGEDRCVLGVDGKKVLLRSLTSTVAGHNCAGLIEKPKVFIIQACQGNQEQPRCIIPQPEDLDKDGPGDTTAIPFEANILIALATVPGYYSFRSKRDGTWFIQTLCGMLNDPRYRYVVDYTFTSFRV